MKKFSIIVPIYRVEKYLDKCIQSILSQSFGDFELLLIDDGSPDNCPKICDKYVLSDKRVKVIHKKNGGLVSARNTGIENAQGQYICYVDGDDWILPNLLETVNNIIDSHADLDIVIYRARRVFDDHTEDIECKIEEGFYNRKRLEKEIFPFMMYDNREKFCKGLIFPVAWNKIFRKELLQKHYCKENLIKMGEDNAFVFECLLYSNNVYFVDKILYEYNQLNATSFANSYDKNRFRNNIILTNYIESRIGDYSDQIKYQINAFKAYWLIMAIFHEARHLKRFKESRNHIKKELKETKTLDNISVKGLPLIAKCYIILLKFHFYSLVLLSTKLMVSFESNNEN